jgi:hypothetical protein
MKRQLTILAAALALAVPAAFGQFAASGTTNLTLTVVPEAALSVTESTPLASEGTLFADYTGTTAFTYKIRTSQTDGTGSITAQVTTNFEAGGPSAAGGDLTYTCSVSAPATGCSDTVTASTAAGTNVAGFGANARSARAGNSGAVNWSLVNDPQYQTGNYTAVVTFTISAL